VRAVAWRPDGKQIATASEDQSVKLWNADGTDAVRTLHGHERAVLAVTWSSDGARLASGGADGTVRVWSADSDKALRVWKAAGVVRSLHWLADDRVAAAVDENVVIWEVETGKKAQTFSMGRSSITAAAWSPDDKRFATVDGGGDLIIWNAQTGEKI